jgi:hypothetical protein
MLWLTIGKGFTGKLIVCSLKFRVISANLGTHGFCYWRVADRPAQGPR